MAKRSYLVNNEKMGLCLCMQRMVHSRNMSIDDYMKVNGRMSNIECLSKRLTSVLIIPSG